MTIQDPEERRRNFREEDQRRAADRARRSGPDDRVSEAATPGQLQRQVDMLGGQLDSLREYLGSQFDAVKATINGKIREQDLKVELAEARIRAAIATVEAGVKTKEELNGLSRRLVFAAAGIFLAAVFVALAGLVIYNRAPGEPVNLRPSAIGRDR